MVSYDRCRHYWVEDRKTIVTIGKQVAYYSFTGVIIDLDMLDDYYSY